MTGEGTEEENKIMPARNIFKMSRILVTIDKREEKAKRRKEAAEKYKPKDQDFVINADDEEA
jgi:hypothetical protein